MASLLTLLNIGFSIIVALILFASYAFFMKDNSKTLLSIVSCLLLLLGLSSLQMEHLNFILSDADPLHSTYYRVLLFLVPPMFFFFCRAILFPEKPISIFHIIHFFPVILVFFVVTEIAVPLAFLTGVGYCFWLLHIIYSIRGQQKQYKIEFFFFGFFSILAVVVLIFGLSLSFIENAYFYYFYANGIALAYMLVTSALIIYPNLLSELNAVVQLGYTASTLGNIDVTSSIKKLDKLMQEDKIFQDETLSLSSLSESLALSSHQLSELINSYYQMSFSRFIREARISEAKRLLIEEPNASILAISLDTGFKSQSNFYAAFKEITRQSPGSFRKDNLR